MKSFALVSLAAILLVSQVSLATTELTSPAPEFQAGAKTLVTHFTYRPGAQAIPNSAIPESGVLFKSEKELKCSTNAVKLANILFQNMMQLDIFKLEASDNAVTVTYGMNVNNTEQETYHFTTAATVGVTMTFDKDYDLCTLSDLATTYEGSK